MNKPATLDTATARRSIVSRYPGKVPAVTDAPRGLIDRMGRDNMAKWDRREEDYARRHGIIAEDDNYAWRIVWIDRLTGAYGSAEGLPYRTRVEAIEAMHAEPMTERFIAQGVVRERTHFETVESEEAA